MKNRPPTLNKISFRFVGGGLKMPFMFRKVLQLQ